MADLTATIIDPRRWKIDTAWLLILAILLAVAVIVPADLPWVITFTLRTLGGTGPFIVFAVAAIAYLKATGAEGVVAAAFTGPPLRMILFASLVGGLAPFCSCEVIPFVAALLAMGVPLAAVMAFWLSSPIMDPPMFLITTAALGLDFAVAKTIAAVGFGLFGGLAVMALSRTAIFADPLRQETTFSGCGCGPNPLTARPVWRFWQVRERLQTFGQTLGKQALFLLKWLALAYLVEALMVRFVPAELIANLLGGDGLQPIFLGALIGGPAYLNGYAAAPLVGGLVEQGMSPGAAMSFLLAGSVSSIPAAIAVWALVRPRVFVAYLGLGFSGALIAGLTWAALA